MTVGMDMDECIHDSVGFLIFQIHCIFLHGDNVALMLPYTRVNMAIITDYFSNNNNNNNNNNDNNTQVVSQAVQSDSFL